jgi:hypothetical protein
MTPNVKTLTPIKTLYFSLLNSFTTAFIEKLVAYRAR